MTAEALANHTRLENAKSKIARCESEFSLGLSRNLSINRELSEFGKFCDSGEMLITVSSYGFRALVGSIILYKLYEKVVVTAAK